MASRSQRTRSVLTFFAQDHASTEMVYANADVTRAEQAREVIAFAEYWSRVAGADPGLPALRSCRLYAGHRLARNETTCQALPGVDARPPVLMSIFHLTARHRTVRFRLSS